MLRSMEHKQLQATAPLSNERPTPTENTMRVYLHSENAEKSARYPVIVAPAGDEEFVSSEDGAKFRNAAGDAIQYQIDFAFGAAEVESGLGAYMVARGIAHKSRLTRVVQQFFDAAGKAIGAVFDQHGRPVLLGQ
jgi:hypothetical protein